MIKAEGRDNPTLYVFYNMVGEVSFVQERIYDNKDDKHDYPWTFWSDGRWRMMEPDGDLPLWGLDRLKDAHWIFIHEGAKCAAFVRAMIESGEWKRHPWGEDLSLACHLGWPGGAPNPHRVDWEPIKRLPPHVWVTLVLDNDPLGENAAPRISRLLKRRLDVIRFGDNFPRNFDLAEPFPAEFWKEKKGVPVYSGPTLRESREPATWATTGTKAGGFALRPEFVEEWCWSIKPDRFMQRNQLDRQWTTDQFNHLVQPYSDVDNVARLLLKQLSGKAETLAYEPGQKTGRINIDGRVVINVYQPSPIKPEEGEPTPFLEFVEHLIPIEKECEIVKKWCATLIARPDIRMLWALLLISQTQGVGKTTLASILAKCVGMTNVSFPSVDQIISQFTTWLAFKRLVIIPELREGHRVKMYEKTKAVITDPNVDVRQMYTEPYTVSNWAHIIASSNYKSAIKFDAESS
jgi:hypothetical protein